MLKSGFLSGARASRPAHANPAAEIKGLISQYHTSWATLEQELADTVAAHEAAVQAYEPTLSDLRSAQDKCSSIQREVSELQAACTHLRAEVTAKEAETSELAKQVEAREADIKGVEVVAAGEDALFLQACDKVHTQLWQLRAQRATATAASMSQ